ncbi:MAG: hypothetical protein RBU24_00695 [Kiritimatiellia bacterium]|nr:hypothetical protein [Kiritimatiellia bacterium]
MTDLTAIAAAVQAMLETVDGFQLVEHSSARRAPEYVPSAVHYFAGAGEADNAALDQVLSWGINLYAPVMDATEGNQHALELIEAVGAAVDAWAPTINGRCLPAVLAEARITEVTDTLLTYYLDLRLSVPAAATANTATGDSLLNAIQTAVQGISTLAATSDCYLAPESGYRPACVGLPSLGIRPAGVTRKEISGCSYDVRYQVELIAHVEADGSTSAASVLDAASTVLIGNLLSLSGVGACRPMDDGAPGLVRDEYARWLVRASRMLEYTISERY